MHQTHILRGPLLLSLILLVSFPLLAEVEPLKAPARLYPEPQSFLMMRLRGDFAQFFYTPGSLDRAANLQERLEIIARRFERWTDERIEMRAFVMNRREWGEAGYDVRYGVPIRVGERGIAAPSRGDPETVALWAKLLDGVLPGVSGTPILGTPEELASMVVSDVLAQFLVGQIIVDAFGLSSDEPWINSVVAHLASLTIVRRAGTDRPEDLDVLYGRFLKRHPPKTFSLRDYREDLSLEDWLWFQAQFYFGARAIYEKEGKDSFKKVRKLGKKGKVPIRADLLRKKYKKFDLWLKENFAVVSRRR